LKPDRQKTAEHGSLTNSLVQSMIMARQKSPLKTSFPDCSQGPIRIQLARLSILVYHYLYRLKSLLEN